ncbi:hypothetical protein M670_00118 [Schinkia azotoformans MEV2011]|uniref:WYL domain-containing protein n=1 Tax=Schinkia azotoformans MEV2011 TaxID=1348973 RepID=A0A072NTE4_SCHAZ|nr:hypothetical protein [Schinkia azotoformans]KEF40103.1 hypothetical protein M670_00118 [Schinkia azotoformans MEV2011]
MIHILKHALESKTLVEMIYMSSSGEISQRILTINAISENHVKAFCHLRKKTRIFKLDNILSALPYKQKRKYVG